MSHSQTDYKLQPELTIEERLILPIDVSTLEEVEQIISQTQGLVGTYKFGLQTLYRFGLEPLLKKVRSLTAAKIFLDLKMKDIPNTLAEGMKAIASYHVDYVTVYADSGLDGLQAIAKYAGAIQVLVVTALTSLSETEVELIYNQPLSTLIPLFADLAIIAGASGIVCSPRDLEFLAENQHRSLIKVTPGIRPHWAANNDQSRVMTPQEAIISGATHLVIGRPIIQPPVVIGDSAQALSLIKAEIELALKTLN